MLNQIKRRILDQYKGVIYYSGGLLLYMWMIISLFPSAKSIDISSFVNQAPDYLKGIYSSGGLKDISTIEGFLSGEILSFFLILIVAFYVAGSASSTIAGAIEKKTMDFQLSQPISRTKYYLSDFITTIGFTAVISGITLLSIKPLCAAYNISINGAGIAKLWLMALIMLLAVYGISLLFSSLLRSKAGVVSLTVGITFALYMLTTLSSGVEKLKPFQSYSLYYYYKPYELMTGSSIEIKDVIVLLLVFIIGSLLGLAIFNKKDI